MRKKVKITAVPNRPSQGLNVNAAPWGKYNEFSEPTIKVGSTLQPVPRDEANLEAEKGEVAMLPGKGGIPSVFTIGGNRHSSGGTPLNLPGDSFIYSDTKDMKIKDPDILKQFRKSKGSYTPADLAKQYKINDYKKILADPDADDLQKSTAEGMITNYNLKLAKLALLQESKKGFPQGIPMAAMPYLEVMQMDPTQFVQQSPQMGQAPGPDNAQMSMYGGATDYFQQGGSNGLPGFDPKGTFASNQGYMRSNYPDYMNMYEKALKSGDPEQMKKAAKVLADLDIPGSVGWLPWTVQDKFDDMSGILLEHAQPKTKPKVTPKEKDAETARRAKEVYNKFYEFYSKATDPIKKAEWKNQLDQLAWYHPIYKEKAWNPSTTDALAAFSERGSNYDPMYTQDEEFFIGRLYDTISKKPVKKAVDSGTSKAQQTAATVSENTDINLDEYEDVNLDEYEIE